jgi:hypothetical protein
VKLALVLSVISSAGQDGCDRGSSTTGMAIRRRVEVTGGVCWINMVGAVGQVRNCCGATHEL